MAFPRFEQPVTPPIEKAALSPEQKTIRERSRDFYQSLTERVATNRLAKIVAGAAMLTAMEGCMPKIVDPQPQKMIIQAKIAKQSE